MLVLRFSMIVVGVLPEGSIWSPDTKCKGPPGRGGGGYGAGGLRLGFGQREEEGGAGRGAAGADSERGEVGKEQSLFYCLLRLITSPLYL